MKVKIANRKRFVTVVFLLVVSIYFFNTYTEARGLVFKDPQYSFQLLRTMGYSSTGGADIGECLSTAYRIKDGNNESWYRQWYKTAKRLEKTADRFLSEGHKQSAREAYFRASNYYRTAEFFLHTNPKDPRIVQTVKVNQKSPPLGRLNSPPLGLSI